MPLGNSAAAPAPALSASFGTGGEAGSASVAHPPTAWHCPLSTVAGLVLPVPAAGAVHVRMLIWSCLMLMGLGM